MRERMERIPEKIMMLICVGDEVSVSVLYQWATMTVLVSMLLFFAVRGHPWGYPKFNP